MEIETLEFAGGVVLKTGDELDLLGHLALAEKVDELLHDGSTNIVVDLESVTYLSSSVARALLALQERAKSAGGGISLAGARGGARAALEAAGVLDVIPGYESAEKAISSLGAA